MRYYLDTEFNGFGGELMSLALVREDGFSLYMIYPEPERVEPWVRANVVPILTDCPVTPVWVNQDQGARHIAHFLGGDANPVIVTDWPDDIRYFCQAMITGPGTMVDVPNVTFRMIRVDAYPTVLDNAVQHNAWWDAKALHRLFEGE